MNSGARCDPAGPPPSKIRAPPLPRRWAPRLYLVTDRKMTGDRGLVETVRRALGALGGANARSPGGLRPDQVAVQLREKDLGGRPLLDLALELRELTAQAGALLFVNDRVDVALAAGADGVHLGGGALSPAAVKTIAPGIAVALSTHSVSEVASAARDPDLTFVVFGPVYDTPSKRGFGRPPLGLAGLADATQNPIPVVALGGIDAARAAACAGAGASGIGFIRAVLAATDPGLAFADMWKKCSGNFRNPLDTTH